MGPGIYLQIPVKAGFSSIRRVLAVAAFLCCPTPERATRNGALETCSVGRAVEIRYDGELPEIAPSEDLRDESEGVVRVLVLATMLPFR
jgi:hypothetical protein